MSDKTNSLAGKRQLKTRVKTARGRKPSSTRWLERQLNDPYVSLAKKEGYRSRAAYKIIEIDDKYNLFKPGKVIVDLGCAPGGWVQVAVKRCASPEHKPSVVGIDLLEVPTIAGSVMFTKDFTDDDAPELLKQTLAGRKVDVVLSDMAPNTTGHAATDHLRIMGLLEMAVFFSVEILTQGGSFVGKVFQGGAEKDVLALLRKHFVTVKHFKPKASRADSAEMYVIATGFRP